MTYTTRPVEIWGAPGVLIRRPRIVWRTEEDAADYQYAVEFWESTDGGRTFAKDETFIAEFDDIYAAEDFRNNMRRNLDCDPMFAYFSRRCTVCDRARIVHGDYPKIAGIDPAGTLVWYVDRLPGYAIAEIESYASEIAKKHAEKQRADG